MSSLSTCSGIRRISLPFYCVLSQGCNPCINSYYSDTIAVNLLMPAWMRVYPSAGSCNKKDTSIRFLHTLVMVLPYTFPTFLFIVTYSGITTA